MSTAHVTRIRWRRRGAWLWPLFAALTITDAIIEHALPPTGDSQALGAGLLSALVINLLAVLLLSRPLGALIRRGRLDTPAIVARDYAGRAAVAGVTATLLLLGLINRPTIDQHRRAMNDAIARAQAYIGARAPAPFRRNIATVDVYALEPGSIYRICVPSDRTVRTYCVIVRTHMALARSVTFAGYEPNEILSRGTG